MRRINILHVTSTPYGLGGVERLLLDMAPHYDLDRFNISHCNLFDETDGAGPFPAALRATGLPFFKLVGRRWSQVPSIVGDLRALVRKERIDILHLHMVRGTIVGGLASVFGLSAKVVVTKHYRYDMLSGAFARILDRIFTNRSHAVVAISGSVRDDLVRHGTAPGRTRIIHNAIDLDVFDRRSTQEPSHILETGAGPLLACFGSLHPLKGHEYAVKAMPEILRTYPTARLLLVGEGGERSRLEQLGRTLALEDSLVMPGFQPNVPAIMPLVDVCLHPSVDEAFGIVLLEAMAARKPVVATNVGGIPEIVEDGRTGLLVSPRDPSAIVDAVCALLGDEPLRKRMGAAGRARVEREFTIRQTVRSYEKLWDEIAGPIPAQLAGTRPPTLDA